MKKEAWLGIGIVLLIAANIWLYYSNKAMVEQQTAPEKTIDTPID